MKYFVTRMRYYFTEIEADSEEEALEKADMVLEKDWYDDDRPDEYSVDCDPEDDEGHECNDCTLVSQCPGYYNGCFEAVNGNKMEV